MGDKIGALTDRLFDLLKVEDDQRRRARRYTPHPDTAWAASPGRAGGASVPPDPPQQRVPSREDGKAAGELGMLLANFGEDDPRYLRAHIRLYGLPPGRGDRDNKRKGLYRDPVELRPEPLIKQRDREFKRPDADPPKMKWRP